MKSKICINQRDRVSYPPKAPFRPNIAYPEYIFGDCLSKQNQVYDMVRETFRMLGMDEAQYGKEDWNPLGGVVKPGDKVLIKPNMVLHHNDSNCGEDCLYTHPSVVAAVIDYIVIALKGRGSIIVGDAPLQECDFEKLIQESGYRMLIDFYRSKGINIELVDFRNVKTYVDDGIHYYQSVKSEKGKVVQLNEMSAFWGLSKERIKNFRVENYDPRIMQKHHTWLKHEYRISEYILDADVIINIPKPKTHRKAGVTISLKNMVGINTNKEYLPHHTLGSESEGGDAYKSENSYLARANMIRCCGRLLNCQVRTKPWKKKWL